MNRLTQTDRQIVKIARQIVKIVRQTESHTVRKKTFEIWTGREKGNQTILYTDRQERQRQSKDENKKLKVFALQVYFS